MFENWLPFWNKFEAEIDYTTLPAVTKFAYLKEPVESKVRADIDGLLLNSEGYERRTYSKENTAKQVKLSTRTFIVFWSSPS